jgi:hypothetical protein
MKPVEVMLVEDNAGDILMVKQALASERYPVSIHVAVDGKQAGNRLAGPIQACGDYFGSSGILVVEDR